MRVSVSNQQKHDLAKRDRLFAKDYAGNKANAIVIDSTRVPAMAAASS
jgi:hypothetical protein